MVLVLNGNSEHVAHAWRKIDLFGGKNPICETSPSAKNALYWSNNQDHSKRAHLFLDNDLISVPWYVMSFLGDISNVDITI